MKWWVRWSLVRSALVICWFLPLMIVLLSSFWWKSTPWSSSKERSTPLALIVFECRLKSESCTYSQPRFGQQSARASSLCQHQSGTDQQTVACRSILCCYRDNIVYICVITMLQGDPKPVSASSIEHWMMSRQQTVALTPPRRFQYRVIQSNFWNCH